MKGAESEDTWAENIWEEPTNQDVKEKRPTWHHGTILAWVIFASFWHNQENLLYFFIYDDLCHIESNNLAQKPIGAFLIW